MAAMSLPQSYRDFRGKIEKLNSDFKNA
jgi:hypothetical protein